MEKTITLGISRPGSQVVEYQVNRISGLNIENRSVYSSLPVAEPFVVPWFIPYLKKQSQFARGHTGASSYLKGSYGYIAASGARKNKANQSQ